MVQLDSAGESTLSQQAQLRGDKLIELWREDVSAKVRYGMQMHNWWEKYLFWYEMHDEIRAAIGSARWGAAFTVML